MKLKDLNAHGMKLKINKIEIFQIKVIINIYGQRSQTTSRKAMQVLMISLSIIQSLIILNSNQDSSKADQPMMLLSLPFSLTTLVMIQGPPS